MELGCDVMEDEESGVIEIEVGPLVYKGPLLAVDAVT